MSLRRREMFTTIRTEGGILPADLLQRISAGDKTLDGLTPASYHLAAGERLNEAVSRAWSRMLVLWDGFRAASEKLAEKDPGTRLTQEAWLLPLFQELGYGRLQAAEPLEVGGRTYEPSHAWHLTTIHLVSFRLDLDHRGRAFAGHGSPHSHIQEMLNRSNVHLWAFVSNGKRLRILRDSRSLTRQSFVEFDLEGMMEGEVYSDFVLLWLLCHQSRVESVGSEPCWLEQWSRAAQEQGVRALDGLRTGVEAAIAELGAGFLKHAANGELRDELRSGVLATQQYYRELLRMVYRMLFLFVAEDRELLHEPCATDEARARYRQYYSLDHLRRLSERTRGSRHADLYHTVRFVAAGLRNEYGCPALGLPALGGFLFSADACPALEHCELDNRSLLTAVYELAYTVDGDVRRVVDYRNLRTEELGSVYEALLEMHTELNVEAGTFLLSVAGGNDRKTTGSYYTPDSLVQCLLDTALDPVLEEAAAKPDPEEAILALKVCDPACGSGHFLIGAAHRIARRLAGVRTGEEEPGPSAVRSALRQIIGRCLYGVDLNPMAVELCKIALWMEALEPGKPLTFLEHHIRVGNSLLGATPRLLADGIPDAAFDPIEGDDRAYCTQWKRSNREYRTEQTTMEPAWLRQGDLAAEMSRLAAWNSDSIVGVHEQEEAFRNLERSERYLYERLWADSWMAAFVWEKRDKEDGTYPLTERNFRNIERNPRAVEPWMRNEIQRLSLQYQFLHWHIAFPDVFRLPSEGEHADNAEAGWSGGFDVVLGNPPWERVKLQEKEFFAGLRQDIANAPNAARRRILIDGLKTEDPALYLAFQTARRTAEGESKLLRQSNRFPLCGRGDVNTYAVFAEAARDVLAPRGRAGVVVPSGIATDDTTKVFFQALADGACLASLYDFENRAGLFPAVDSRMKFTLLTMGRTAIAPHGADLAFFAHSIDELSEPGKRFCLAPSEIRLLNPNTRTCPVFRSRRDADITLGIYQRVPVLIEERPDGDVNPWGVRFMAMLHMSNDSELFRTRSQMAAAHGVLNGNCWEVPGSATVEGQVVEKGTYLPLYEAKMMQQFDHRAADVVKSPTAVLRQNQPLPIPTSAKLDPNRVAAPIYWVHEHRVKSLIGERHHLMGFSNVTSPTNMRTMIASMLPRSGVGHSMPLITSELGARAELSLLAMLNGLCFDYISRMKLGGVNFTFGYLRQIAVPTPPELSRKTAPEGGDWFSFILPRVLELVYTAYDMTPLAHDCGFLGAPFIWDDRRRLMLRCELDAAIFRLYGIERADVGYIIDTFPIVKRHDEERYGEFRTKRLVLEIYDAMLAASSSGYAYQSSLDPPPANGWMPPVRAHVVPADKQAPRPPTISSEAVSDVEFQPQPERGANVYFRRAVLAAEIVSQMHEAPTFGHVKLMKVFEVCQLAADLGDLETVYYRQAAGPLDRKLLFSIDSQLKQQKWFEAKGDKTKGYRYLPLQKMGGHRTYYERYWADRDTRIQRVIEVFRTLNTYQSEILATLYTAWNDLLLDGTTPSDEDIIYEATINWHAAKSRIGRAAWIGGLDFLRRKDLVPEGTGKRSRTAPGKKAASIVQPDILLVPRLIDPDE